MLMGMTTTITHLAGLEFFYWYFISIYTKIHLTEESSFINVTKTEANVIGTYPEKKNVIGIYFLVSFDSNIILIDFKL